MPPFDLMTAFDDQSQPALVRILSVFQNLSLPLTEVAKGEGPEANTADILLCLGSEALMAYSDLSQAVAAKRAATAAFYSRNLLELLVWTRYCRSEEHTSELQSQFHLVCRLL